MTPINNTAPLITKESKFYGYLTGIHLGSFDSPETTNTIFAPFEYNGLTTWQVPDFELFKILTDYLCDGVQERYESDGFGRIKLWIEKKDGKWIVELP